MKINPNLVFIYSIPRPSAFGIDKWTTENGVKLKKNKVGRAADYIRALYSPKVGGLANYISHTPWLEKGDPQLDDVGKPKMLQEKYEQKWNLPKDFLHNRPAPITPHLGKAPLELSFFQSQRWKMVDGCTVLDRSKMEDDMGYYVMLASSKIANSEREYREHKWPKALWYIAIENETETLRYERSEMRTKAFAALHSVELTEDYKRKIVSLLDITSATSDVTFQQVHNFLVAYIENSSSGPSSNIEKFFFYVNKLKTKDGRDEFEAMWLLKLALDTTIVLTSQDTYTWIRRSGAQLPIGNRYSEAIAFLLNPNKAQEIEEMIAQINAKTKTLI